jgi:hypothetical protein
MAPSDARTYLIRLALLHAAFIMAPAGILLAGSGLPNVGLGLFAFAFACMIGANASATYEAVRSRNGKPWFGGGSVLADIVERTGWSPMDDAARSLRLDPRRVRRTFVALNAIAVIVIVALFAATVAGVTR